MNKEQFNDYITIFLEQNGKLNLISKNDEKFLWEKHIYDSLSIKYFIDKYKIENFSGKELLDIGTGGGFPSIPIAIMYPELAVTALDSIQKKINAIYEIKNSLDLKNLYPLCDRAENIKKNFDFITSRAVASMKKLIPYAIPLIKPEGYFIAYKSIKAEEELQEAKEILKKYRAKVTDIIEYQLPLEENHTRNLVIIQKI